MKPNRPLHDIRTSYDKGALHKTDLNTDPFLQFKQWFDNAVHDHPSEVNAMTLATVDSKGRPSARIVLLKDIEEGGFVFYTNYQSRKGREMEANPQAALLFFWPAMEQQIRIEGAVMRLKEEISTTYFQSRPRGSQLGAWASPQSSIIPGREPLIEKIEQLQQTYQDEQVLPKPPFWGGYVLKPDYFEFWQGRTNRLHDRFTYRPSGAGSNEWTIDRLAP